MALLGRNAEKDSTSPLTSEAKGKSRGSRDTAEAGLSRSAARRLLVIAGGLGAMIGATYFVPALAFLQPWKPSEDYVPFWNVVGRHLLGEGDAIARQKQELERLQQASKKAPKKPSVTAAQPSSSEKSDPPWATFPPLAPESIEEVADVEVPIDQPERLDAYYRRLALVDLEAPGIIARAAHWGDSLLGDDGMTAAIRRRLQERFGDGGHGFHLLAPFNPFHMHRGIRFKIAEPWNSRCEVHFRCESDSRYGLGGVSARSSGGGESWFETAKEPPGDRISRFELWYEREPKGGIFQVKIDRGAPVQVDTQGDKSEADIAVFELPDGPHEIRVRAAGRGSVRGYGVVFERSGPGVVWDNLAIIGLGTGSLRHQDPEHIRRQVELRRLDLLVFGLGGNDAQRGKTDLETAYEGEYTQVIQNYRAGRPQASCLVMSLTDHGERTANNAIRTRKSVPVLVEIQRKVAEAQGCAFLDLFRAMGGDGAIARWYHARPALASADLGHPTSAGHEVLATLVYRALMHGYQGFRERMVGKPFPEWEEISRGKAPKQRPRVPQEPQ